MVDEIGVNKHKKFLKVDFKYSFRASEQEQAKKIVSGLQSPNFTKKRLRSSPRCRCREPGVAPGISRRGLTLPTRRLKYGFQGTINAKHLRKNRFSPSDGGKHAPTGGI